MSLRRSLAAALAAGLLLTACAGDETRDDVPGVEQPDDGQTASPREDQTDQATDDATGDEDAAAGSQPVTVALSLDGQRVPLASACNGVDGAVLATTEGEVTISLVQEEGTALRYQAEGFTAETDDVEVEEVATQTIYRATLESDELPAVDVELEVGDTSALDDC